MAVLNTIQTLNNIIPLEFRAIKTDLEPGVDPILAKIVETSEGVSTGISHQWQVVHTYTVGVAGAIKNVNPTAASTVDTDITGQTTMWDTATLASFPGLGEETNPGYVQKTISLVEMMGILSIPYEITAAEELDPIIVKPVMVKMKGCAKNALAADCASIYANASHKGALIKIITVATGITFSGSDKILTINFGAASGTAIEGRVGRMYPGQTLGFVKNGTSVLHADGLIVVRRVDYIGKTATLSLDTDAAFTTADYTANSIFVLYGTTISANDTPVGPSGILSYVKDSGTIGASQAFNGFTAGGPGALTIANYPQFRSLVASLGAVLDEAALNKYVGGFYDAYGDVYDLDSIITTTGALNAYMEQIDGLYRYERNNKRLTLREGWSSMDYAWQGQTFDIAASRWMTAQNAWILKLNNNWMRYVPPSVPATSKRAEFHRDIRFIAPFLGSANIWLPARAATTAALTKFASAPFIWLREYCPEQIPGIVLTGVQETNP